MPVDAAQGPSHSLPPEFLERLVERLRHEQPDLQAVLLSGSFARGEQDAHSDLDLMALTTGPAVDEERIWFERLPGGRLLHVSVGIEALSVPENSQPASWALGFPAIDVQRYIWATSQARTMLGEDPSDRYPAGTPELGDFIEQWTKVRRAARAGDQIALRWEARVLAEFAPGLLRPLNPERVVRTPIEALRAARDLPLAPPHYRDDFTRCAGVAAVDDTEITLAAEQLARDMLDFLRQHQTRLIGIGEDLRQQLADGTIHQYLELEPITEGRDARADTR